MNRVGVALVFAALALAIAPVLVLRRGEAAWSGTDGQATALIRAGHAGYRPWIGSLWTPPSPEIDSLLFASQAALGAGSLGYVFGYLRGRASVRITSRRGEKPA